MGIFVFLVAIVLLLLFVTFIFSILMFVKQCLFDSINNVNGSQESSGPTKEYSSQKEDSRSSANKNGDSDNNSPNQRTDAETQTYETVLSFDQATWTGNQADQTEHVLNEDQHSDIISENVFTEEVTPDTEAEVKDLEEDLGSISLEIQNKNDNKKRTGKWKKGNK